MSPPAFGNSPADWPPTYWGMEMSWSGSMTGTRPHSILPDEWLACAAVGDAAHCADRIKDQLDLGADSVVLHGATPDELAPVLAVWRANRDPSRFAHLTANPGRIHR